MINLAKALIYATTYINLRTDKMDAQNDAKALESIAGYLSDCTNEEKKNLEKAIQNLIIEETNSKLLKDYKSWIEDMNIE